MTDADRKRINWAHSVLNDKGHSMQKKTKAAAVLKKLDPEGLDEHKADILA